MTPDHRMTARRVAAHPSSWCSPAAPVRPHRARSRLRPRPRWRPSGPPRRLRLRRRLDSHTPPDTDSRPDAPGSCVDRTLASMSEPQRIGQVFMIGLVKDKLDAAERAAVADFHFGSFAFTTQSRAGVTAIRAITDAVQALATKKATAGVGFFVAANQEGGLIQGLGGPGFDVIPSALDQGAMTVATLKQKAARWGQGAGPGGRQSRSRAGRRRRPARHGRVERPDRPAPARVRPRSGHRRRVTSGRSSPA